MENLKIIKHFEIPKGIEIITWDVFSGIDKTKIESITIPNSVEKIGAFAFSNCTSLKSITIPNSVKKIGLYAVLIWNWSNIT